jgi:hypothetical protein
MKNKQNGTIFDKTDCFTSDAPSFNIQGNQKVGTSIGTFFSIIITVIMLLFVYGKADRLINSRNPTVNEYTNLDKRGVNEEGE